MNTVNENAFCHKNITTYSVYNVGKCLVLGLLLSTTSITRAYEEEQISQEVIQELDEQVNLDKMQHEIDEELLEIFKIFFDKNDTTPFYKIVTKVITLLKLKKTTLPSAEQTKCNEIIHLLEKNKHNSFYPTWAKILISSDLMNLMSPETKAYINNVPLMRRIQALQDKLKNNPHSFF